MVESVGRRGDRGLSPAAPLGVVGADTLTAPSVSPSSRSISSSTARASAPRSARGGRSTDRRPSVRGMAASGPGAPVLHGARLPVRSFADQPDQLVPHHDKQSVLKTRLAPSESDLRAGVEILGDSHLHWSSCRLVCLHVWNSSRPVDHSSTAFFFLLQRFSGGGILRVPINRAGLGRLVRREFD